ncbi:MAG: FkbM family methyltransferase [Saprospiraceae bacterium]|nr:FkbM family methyltransferase [Saprospiraceae bacterium]
MSYLRKIFYNRSINKLLRNILWPIRHYLTYGLKFPVNGEIEVFYENQKILFTANETSPMLRELFWKHKFCDFEFSAILCDLVKKSNTFFDVGANIGYYSVLAKKCNPDIKVYSFEPSNGPFHFLEQNIKINHLNNIHLYKKAVGNQICTIDFYEDINPKFKYLEHHVSGSGNTANTWENDQVNKYSVACVTIDGFVEENKIESLDLIKVDTEATEDKVLIGALGAIQKYKPIIICEVLPNKIENEILSIVTSMNYMIYHHIESLNKLILVSDFSNSLDRNYIFVPKEKVYLINKYIQ